MNNQNSMFLKKSTRIIMFFLLGFMVPALGQIKSRNEADSIIFKALKDELYRNLNQLYDKETGKPFFISYTYLDGEVTEASALLGTLHASNKFRSTSWSIRLMMGDYEINDENFQDNYSREQTDNIPITRQPPIEYDYEGIRNTFWWNTSNVFQSAVKNYKSKLAALKDKPVADGQNLLPDYTRAAPVKMHLPGTEDKMTKEKLELFVKDISNVFRDFRNVTISDVSAYHFNSFVYIINTEGSEIRLPLNLVTVSVSASVFSSKGEVFRNSISYIANSFEGLPPADTIKHAARTLADYLLQLRNSEIINEKYTGPVLFEDNAAAGIFAGCLFGREKQLIADRDPLVNSLSKSMLPKNNFSRESKLEKRIISKDLTVRALPHLKTYNGITLFGSFAVDAECIVPPEEILLVEDGVLKNMLCDRIPTKNFKQSNGHNRIGLGYGGYITGLAPGVIKIEAGNSMQTSGLKQKMIEIANEKGLEYVLVVKPLIGGACHSPFCFYKLNVSTGNEELIYNMSLPGLELKYLNKIAGTGSGTIVNNQVFSATNYRNTASKSGFPTSFILPDALLIEEMELSPVFPYSDLDVPYYDSQSGSDE